MTNIIFVGGQKGGSGKSTTSHLFCLGAILSGQPAAYVLTDPQRAPKAEGRPYGVIDARLPDTLAQVIASSTAAGNGWLCIDGGGNRQAFDEHMATIAVLTIVPFGDTEESLEAAARDLARLQNAYALPTAWPTNKKAQDASYWLIEGLERVHPGRVLLPPSLFVHSCNELLGTTLDNPSTAVRSLARRIFQSVSLLHDRQRDEENSSRLQIA
jgi:hypothetical protein